MPKSPESVAAAKNSTCSAPITRRTRVHSNSSNYFANLFADSESLCIFVVGKRSSVHDYQRHISKLLKVNWAQSRSTSTPCSRDRLPKQRGCALSLYTIFDLQWQTVSKLGVRHKVPIIRRTTHETGSNLSIILTNRLRIQKLCVSLSLANVLSKVHKTYFNRITAGFLGLFHSLVQCVCQNTREPRSFYLLIKHLLLPMANANKSDTGKLLPGLQRTTHETGSNSSYLFPTADRALFIA